MTKRIAIIGAGISGLTAAYLLNKHHDITLYEMEGRLGGHTATIDVELLGRARAIDTGFIVYNDWTYPNFIELLDQLGVATQPTSMGFSVSCKDSGLEYAGNNLNTLFAQRRNLLSPSFWRMLKDIVRFNRHALADLRSGRIDTGTTLGDYLYDNAYSQDFAKYYLIPMGSAIWSASLASMRAFPVKFFVNFFHNHGLLNILNRPQWRVITGGSRQYIAPLIASYKDKVVTAAKIAGIRRDTEQVTVLFEDGGSQQFDEVVLATHSDQALSLLHDPSEAEREVLGDIPYSENSVVLHHDENLLPKCRRTWSSWNYLLGGGDDDALPVLTYNMNILQSLDSDTTFCVTLNAESEIDPAKIIGRFRYAHPQFSPQTMHAQARWSEVNGVRKTWYCGAYWANGFHEDGVKSAVRIAEQFGIGL